ncbi:YraN family protein [Hymenobacter weizhouensis]|uniref:YraN family protein n=1 Tax=Hymenobacter sp. YIM 151500-1 TaxID=2987689 RepID=UPI002225FCF3|nr:YraN family protein [Hymenobacter sp. YIM 151500-1]UYZ61929.1 YraN family protein [Hymenobacter sp. YIM 151500-1]
MPLSAHQLGHDGEDAALRYLEQRGYTLVHRNYRHRRAEVDLIVRQGHELLVFVEVKARSSVQYGHPEEFVTERKRQLLRLAAEQVQEDLSWSGDIRFDIVALTPTAAGLRVEHFEDAFY